MRKLIIVIAVLLLTGCNTIPVLGIAEDAKCKTEIAKKNSKLICQFEGKKLLGKK